MKLQKRSVEAVLNLIGSLQGTAWKLVESVNWQRYRAVQRGSFC